MVNKDTYKRLTETKKINEYCSTVECGEHCEYCYVENLYERLAELEDKIQNGEIIFMPKYKLKQTVYWVFDKDTYWKGQIDGFDIFTQKYLVYIDIGFSNAWCCEEDLFATEKQAKAKLNELKGE